jgi:diguanylate cyclase (GGDEF)-like protein
MSDPLQERELVSLRSKILAMSTIPLVVLTFAVVYAVSAQRTASRTNAEVDNANIVGQQLSEIQDDLAVAESSVRGFLLTAEPEMLAAFGQAVRYLRRDLAELDTSLVDKIQREPLDRLDELVTERLETFRAVLQSGVDRTPELQARLESHLLRDAEIATTLRALLGSMRRTVNEHARERTTARDAAFDRSYLVQVIAMPLAILAAMILMASFTGGMVRRVTRMRHNAVRLEQGQPLERPDASRDELGSLSRALVRTGKHVSELQEELRRHATVDDLTGLANRRGFFALGEHELLVAARTRSSVALLFLDVDGLKHVNDELGHVVGDLLLKEAADVIRETIRASDIAGRLGGDEFCVLLMGDPELDPERVVERMRDTLAVHNARSGRTFRVAVSMGVSSLPPGRSVTLEELIDAADERMYEDKRARHAVSETARSI